MPNTVAIGMQEMWDQATKLHQMGKLAQAEQLFSQIMITGTAEIAARHQLGVLRFQQGRYDEALADFDWVVAHKPDFAEAWYIHGIVLAAMNRPAEALVSFGKVLALNPDHLCAHSERGSALMALQRPREALASFDRALAIAPDDAQLLYRRGSLLVQCDRGKEALESFDKAIAAMPNHVAALFMRGLVLAGVKCFTDALTSFEAVLQIDPGHFEALYNRGIALWHLRRPAAALEDFEKILTIDPSFAPNWHNRGNALRELWRLDEALASYEKALALKPDYVDAMKGRGQVLFEMNRTDDGLAAFREAALRIYGGAESPSPISEAQPHCRLSHDREQHIYLECRKSIPAGTLGGRLAGPAVRPDIHAADIVEQWWHSQPQIVVIDNLLTPEALAELRRFCLEAPMWRASYPNGYMGAFPEHGFACPLLGQIADELRDALPEVFRSHFLNYMWGFKYDSHLSGIGIHADFAAVNVNFWITPDEANLDVECGGLVIWDAAAPSDWDFDKYNGEAAAIRDFLSRNGAKSVTVPYRANRAVMFNSDLFHETDRLSFKDGYENRRINVTMLYGRRGANT